jgi:hypothetical protein
MAGSPLGKEAVYAQRLASPLAGRGQSPDGREHDRRNERWCDGLNLPTGPIMPFYPPTYAAGSLTALV